MNLGAWHSIDVQYTWGYPQLFVNPEALNHSRLVDIANYTETDLAYADFMMTLITNFAKTRQNEEQLFHLSFGHQLN